MKPLSIRLQRELNFDLGQDFGSSATRSKFIGTTNPRHLRILNALQRDAITREELDRVAGASNSPDLIAELRRRGLDIPCNRVRCMDRDGKTIYPGVYMLTHTDVRKVQAWRAKEKK